MKPLEFTPPKQKEEKCCCSTSGQTPDNSGEFAAKAFGTPQKENEVPINPFASPCACGSAPVQDKKARFSLSFYGIVGTVVLIGWGLLYSQLPSIADALTGMVPGVTAGSHLSESIRFFLYDTPKILLLLSLVVFAVGILRTWITPERSRKYLSGKESLGNVIAACVGIVTPFCSCSAVPLFLGFVAAGIPLGVTFSFLIAAPMVNEIALVLLYGLFGFKVAALYLVTGVTIAVIAGWVLGKMKLENLLEPWVRQIRDDGSNKSPVYPSFAHRLDFAWDSVVDILSKTWLYIVIGIAVGAGIHGYVPEGAMASIMGKDAWWSVPAAVAIGVPMYASAAGIIPIVSALLGKGAALGTALAFMMSVVALSLPEMVILRKVLSIKLISIYVAIVASGILLVGFLFNIVI
ncbi:permease [Halodesulfovibrio aestuarii]|uniref:Permease n=1 Tax=Halodesulfovibrio aestuarii TaxID=126333 RepID=A0A8G2C6W9_9BACT|nr:permease [Halodesulfovibrio aestuarii]SHI52713.1 hypothetical protein SAMN05660830_00213 [Halodesulfovibrio aestuarii]